MAKKAIIFSVIFILVLSLTSFLYGQADANIVPGQQHSNTPLGQRIMGFFGIFVLIAIAYGLSVERKSVKWRPVVSGVILQLLFALIVLSPALGDIFFTVVDTGVRKLLSFSEEGTAFVLQSVYPHQVDTIGPEGFQPETFPKSEESFVPSVSSSVKTFASWILPTIIFFSALMTILYHLGIMQILVKIFAFVMQKTMGTSGSESLSAAANIFVGQTEAPLVVKPFVESMTKSELHAIMVGGFATVAGGVMAVYVSFLKDIPHIAGHLVVASIMSAPAALAISKIMYPETEESKTAGDLKMHIEKPDANVIEAAARGASEGLYLMLNVIAVLIAFVGIVAMVNFALSFIPVPHTWTPNQHLFDTDAAFRQDLQDGNISEKMQKAFADNKRAFAYAKDEQTGEQKQNINIIKAGENQWMVEDANAGKKYLATVTSKDGKEVLQIQDPKIWLSLQVILGWLFFPIAFCMGVPLRDCFAVGMLLGEKIVLTEILAYIHLGQIQATLAPRSAIIATYALCGFANFASIGIQIGGIGAIAPKRRADLSRLGLRAMIGGTLAACMTGTVAGILL